MNISKISAVNNYDCSFGARRRGNRIDYEKRYRQELSDYFARGYNNLDSEDIDPDNEFESFDARNQENYDSEQADYLALRIVPEYYIRNKR